MVNLDLKIFINLASASGSLIKQPTGYVITPYKHSYMFKLDSPLSLHSSLQYQAGVCWFRERSRVVERGGKAERSLLVHAY